MKVPEGFELNVFASEKMFPDLVKKAKPASRNRLAYTASQIGKQVNKYREKGLKKSGQPHIRPAARYNFSWVPKRHE